eukprot:5339715-Alexandrium_andersonii.AAC.1
MGALAAMSRAWGSWAEAIPRAAQGLGCLTLRALDAELDFGWASGRVLFQPRSCWGGGEV